MSSDPCGPLTDTQYLQHMIPHHQVALDMSRALLQVTKWPALAEMARNIVWVQDKEIRLMTSTLNHIQVDPVTSPEGQNRIYVGTWGDLTPPNTVGISDTPCDPSFFNSQHHHSPHGQHSQHNQPITDEAYIAHMIPHHQVAVDMSKRLLQSTCNDYMIDLAYTIIRSQQAEIARLSALSKTAKWAVFESELIQDVGK